MDRIKLKENAKKKLYRNYGVIAQVAIILIMFGAIKYIIDNVDFGLFSAIIAVFMYIFVTCLQLGFTNVFLKIAKEEKVTYKDLFDPFKENALEKVGTILLKNLYLTFWTILFVIPGIIKAFAYSQVEYVLVDEDNKKFFGDAITESRKLMNGKKLELFTLMLSFLLWNIAMVLTVGILGVYVVPYENITFASYYLELKKDNMLTICTPRWFSIIPNILRELSNLMCFQIIQINI